MIPNPAAAQRSSDSRPDHQKHDIQRRQSGRKNTEIDDPFDAPQDDRSERSKDGTAVEQNKFEHDVDYETVGHCRIKMLTVSPLFL
jgi:hypothetical protein